MSRKPPKNLNDYTDGAMAAAQLIHLAMDLILFRKGKVRWNLTLHCWEDNPNGVVALQHGSFSSTNPDKEEPKVGKKQKGKASE